MPTATIIQNVSATVPSGFLYCDGTLYQRTGTYAKLFGVIDTTFGSTDSSNFRVPDFRAAFLRGIGTRTLTSPDATYTAANLGTLQRDDVLKHIHTYSDMYWSDDLQPNRTIALTGEAYEVPGGDNNGCNTDGNYSKRMTSSSVFAANATQPPNNQYTDPVPAIGAETRPINYSVYYYIRY